MVEAAVDEATQPAPPRRSRRKRALRWTFGILAALVALVIAGVVLLNTPVGERFIAARIAERTFPNGLNIRIGRIDGNIYRDAVLHDVVLSDPKGVFATIPQVEIDWNPRGWLSNRLDIRRLALRQGTLRRLPEFTPSGNDNPILPGFDISVDRLEVAALTLAPGIAGDTAQRVDMLAEVQVDDRRLYVDGQARLGLRDRLRVLVDAEPDGDNFDLALDLDAVADGPLAALAGLDDAYSARIRGDGTWRSWAGALVARSGERRVAALQVTNRAGRFGVLGKLDPSDFLTGLAADALGNDVAVKGDVRIDSRVFDGSLFVVGRGILARGQGSVDLADNRFDNLRIAARLRDPRLLDRNTVLQAAVLDATLDGPFDALTLEHDLRIAQLTTGGFDIRQLRQRGTARFDGTRWTVPLNLAAARVESGNALVDPRLVNGTGRGQLILTGNRLYGEDLRLAFPGLAANLALRGDLSAKIWRIAGPVRADGLEFRNIGRGGGTAMVDLRLAPGGVWRLEADVDGRIARVTNATLADLAGPAIRVRGGIATGRGTPLTFDGVRLDAARLAMTLDGSLAGGTTQLAGRGRQAQYGEFTVEARIADGQPTAELVFARPATGLENVRLALAPIADGFAIDATGGSALGPFEGAFALFSPRGGPTRIDIRQLDVSNTAVTGAVTLVSGGVAGNLALSGGGVSGTVALTPRGGGQGLDLALNARDARFGGSTALAITRGTLTGQGVIAEGRTSFSGRADAQGLTYGSLFIGRLAARGNLTDGRGRVDANLTGSRGSRFALDLNALFEPDRIGVAAKGAFGGRAITMPRRAILTRLEDGGWRLAPAQLNYGSGAALISGQSGGGEAMAQIKLARMPLSLTDAFTSDLGLGGTISGVIDFRDGPATLPTGQVRVKVDDLTRSGLVLTSRPLDLSLVARLDANRLEARATMANADIRRGRVQAVISQLPDSGDLTQRLRAGRLSAQLRYQGAAESLWRLAAVDAIDLTGPVALAANATGTLADPRVRGSVRSDDLRVRSSLSGTDVRNVNAVGRFEGSRLQLTRFAGTVGDEGSVTGSGLIDLAGLGERVQGRFTEIRGPTLDLRASAKGARLLNANGLSATVTGPLRIVSNGLGGTIAGRVRIDRARWTLGTAGEDMRLPQISTREVNLPPDRGRAPTTARPWRYLVDARGPGRIDVDGMGLNSEWRANVTLRGTTSEPRIGGSARVVQGDYTFAGTQFELTRGEITFDESGPIDPRLDIRAETDRQGLTVIATVTGNAAEPEIAFTSEPILPEEEILARLLFGGSITSLSATDALQLGAALASLRGGAGMDPINRLRSAIGLDRLRIVAADPVLDRGTAVAIGKNLGRRVYVELITDGRGYSATEVEFRVTSWLSLLANISTIGRESAVAEVSRDY